MARSTPTRWIGAAGDGRVNKCVAAVDGERKMTTGVNLGGEKFWNQRGLKLVPMRSITVNLWYPNGMSSLLWNGRLCSYVLVTSEQISGFISVKFAVDQTVRLLTLSKAIFVCLKILNTLNSGPRKHYMSSLHYTWNSDSCDWLRGTFILWMPNSLLPLESIWVHLQFWEFHWMNNNA